MTEIVKKSFDAPDEMRCSGRIKVRMDDGSEAEFGAGDVGIVPPGHDAWIVGNEPFMSIDFPNCRLMTPSSERPIG